MANTPISSLAVYVGSSLPAGTYLEVSTPDGLSSTGFSSYRATPEQIVGASLAGYVPTSRIIGTNVLSGLNGGGNLTTDRYLSLDVDNLSEKTTPTVADAIAMNNAVDNTPVKVTTPNFYKTIAGLTHKSVPLSTDLMLVYSTADSDSRYSTLGEALGAAGSVPPGGTTGQPLIKLSGADYNTGFATLPLAGGGTNSVLTASNGGIVYSSASALEILAGTATANQIPMSASNAAPSWSTATYPATTTANQLLYSSAANTIGGLATANNSILVTDGTGVPSLATTLPAYTMAGNINMNAYDITDVNILLAGDDFGFMQTHTHAGDTWNLQAYDTNALSYVNQFTMTAGNPPTADLSTSVTLGGAYIYRVGGTDVSATDGGTGIGTYALGDTLYASAANTLSKLAGNTTSGIQYLSQTGTGTVSAAPTWNTIAGGDITGAALTKTDDTNVTLTLGGSPADALLRATSLTLGWTGQLGATRGGTGLGTVTQGDLIYGSAANVWSALAKNTSSTRYLSNTGTNNNPAWSQIDLTNGVTGILPLANGGTNANLTASNGGIVYSTASGLAILAGTATAGQVPRSGSSAAPSWSTATYPDTTSAGTVLASTSANVVAATATPTLGANGGTGGQITLNGSTSGSAALRVAAAAGTGTVFQLPASNGTNGYVLQTNGSGVTSWAAAGDVVGPASATDNAAARFDLATGKLIQGSLFIIDDSGSVSSFGGNITFPSTQVPSANPNTLDDYEEGTFTPTITFGGASVGITYSSQVGVYTKIGNLVTIGIAIVLTNKGSSTGAAMVGGLPFNVTSADTFPLNYQANNMAATAATDLQAQALASTTTISLVRFAAGAGTAMTNTDFNNNTVTRISGQYFT